MRKGYETTGREVKRREGEEMRLEIKTGKETRRQREGRNGKKRRGEMMKGKVEKRK